MDNSLGIKQPAARQILELLPDFVPHPLSVDMWLLEDNKSMKWLPKKSTSGQKGTHNIVGNVRRRPIAFVTRRVNYIKR